MTEIHALSGAYAVDALDDIERAQFERHLDDCAECRAEVTSLRAAGSLLAETVPAAPSAELRAKVLADIKSVRPLPPVTKPVVRTRRVLPRLVAAAVTAVVLAGGAVTWHPWTEESTQQVSMADRVLTAKDAAQHDLHLPSGSATLVTSASVGRAVMVTNGVADPPKGKVYELWLQDTHGVMNPAGLMRSGSAQKILLKGDVNKAFAAGVTVEPAAGSEKPTSEPIALVGLRRSA